MKKACWTVLTIMACSTLLWAAAADAFTRADASDLGSNWLPAASGRDCKIVQGAVFPTTIGLGCFEVWTADSFIPNQTATVTLDTWGPTGDDQAGVFVRSTTDGLGRNLYICVARRGGANTSYIRKYVADTGTDLVTENATTWASGDSLSCRASGSTIALYRNASAVALLSVTDTALTTGNPGISVFTDAAATTAADTFTRANAADLGSDWLPEDTGRDCMIVSAAVFPTTVGLGCFEVWTTSTFGPDQTATLTLSTWTASGDSQAGVFVRGSTAGTGRNLYICVARQGGSNTSYIRKYVADTPTDLQTENATTWAATDTLSCNISGPTITLSRNGTPLIATADTEITSGNPGISVFNDTSVANVAIDDFSASWISPVSVDNFSASGANLDVFDSVVIQ